jgi:hypothetical protein
VDKIAAGASAFGYSLCNASDPEIAQAGGRTLHRASMKDFVGKPSAAQSFVAGASA